MALVLLDIDDDLLRVVIAASAPEDAQRIGMSCTHLARVVASTPHTLMRAIVQDAVKIGLCDDTAGGTALAIMQQHGSTTECETVVWLKMLASPSSTTSLSRYIMRLMQRVARLLQPKALDEPSIIPEQIENVVWYSLPLLHAADMSTIAAHTGMFVKHNASTWKFCSTPIPAIARTPLIP